MSDRVLQTNVLQQGESMLARTLLTSIIFMSAVSRTSVYGTNEQLQKEKNPVCISGTFYISGFIHNDRVTAGGYEEVPFKLLTERLRTTTRLQDTSENWKSMNEHWKKVPRIKLL